MRYSLKSSAGLAWGIAVLILVWNAWPVWAGAIGERTSVLFVGAVEGPSLIPGGPFWHLEHDPFFEVTPVRAMWLMDLGYEHDVMERAVRLYMPRTYEDLLLEYDAVSLIFASKPVIKAKYAKWFSDAVLEGKGLVFAGQDRQWGYDWMTTTVGDILPVEMPKPDITVEPAKIRIVKDDHPLTASLPWSNIGEHGYMYGRGYVNAKEGGEVLAELVPPMGSIQPFLVWWDIGKGRSIAMMTRFSAREENPFLDWEFFPDFSNNLHLYAAHREIPQNPELLHRIRLALEDHALKSGLLVSTVEFISQLDGDTSQLDKIISLTMDRLGDVEELYLAYEFEASLELVKDNILDLEQAEELAMKIKDHTFLWIYAIEWSVLTSTSLGTGAVIWSLMIKRRLYAEVGTTKLTRTPTELYTAAIGSGGDTG